VGFPGETENDVEATLDLIRQIQFDGLFAFIYSDRPNAPAAHFGNKISEFDKKARLQAVLACQEAFTIQKNQALVGSLQRVLVDGLSKNGPREGGGGVPENGGAGAQWAGRTGSNKIVHFVSEQQTDASNQRLTGLTLEIMIEKAMPHSLWGRPTSNPAGFMAKGEQTHAA
jgi:tRNA-2-methylthio-N6-dimethylallyladenosine synthase